MSAASGFSSLAHALAGSRAGTVLADGTATFLIRNITATFTIRILNVPAILCGAFFVLRIILRAILFVAMLGLITVIGFLTFLAIIVAFLTARESSAASIAHFAFGSFLLLGRELFVNRLIAFGNADSSQLFNSA